MSLDSISDRFSKLRAMRDKLCKQEHNWEEAFKARDWVVNQLKDLKKVALDPDATPGEFLSHIDNILSVLSPDISQDDSDAD